MAPAGPARLPWQWLLKSKRPAAKRTDDGGPAAAKYKRGERNVINSIKDKKLRMEIRRSEKAAREAAARAARGAPYAGMSSTFQASTRVPPTRTKHRGELR